VQGVILLALLENVTVYLRVVGYYETFFRALILIGVVVFDVVHMKWLNLRLERTGLFQLQRANSLP